MPIHSTMQTTLKDVRSESLTENTLKSSCTVSCIMAELYS
jgi:hypothetical protein